MAIKYICDLCGKEAANEVVVSIRTGIIGDKPVLEEKIRHTCAACTTKIRDTWKIK